MNLKEQRVLFELNRTIYETARLTFHGVDGFDVYNTSTPFQWCGQIYLFGRVERRSEWARSWVRLFSNTGSDDWTVVPNSMIYQLEDPYVSQIGGLLVMGGSHVRYKAGKVDTYYGYFYRGTDLHDLVYFTTGPNYMKDIRLVELEDGRIGVFSRPRNQRILEQYGSESQIGFTVINTLDELTADVIENAPYIPGLFGTGEWGGCNQAYLLEDGSLGVIGHHSYYAPNAQGVEQQVYLNVAFVLDRRHHALTDFKIIGTRPCYPASPAKKPFLTDCAFTSGIVMRPDDKVDLYSGLSDTAEGRIVINYPFAGHGRIVSRSVSLPAT